MCFVYAIDSLTIADVHCGAVISQTECLQYLQLQFDWYPPQFEPWQRIRRASSANLKDPISLLSDAYQNINVSASEIPP